MDPKAKLNTDGGDILGDVSEYTRLISRLLYLNLSRPNIIFIVHKLSQFLAKPRLPHLQAIHHLLRYLKNSPGPGLFFSSSSSIQLDAFSNADWCSCLETRKSITDFCVFIVDSIISWKVKKQNTVFRSFAKIEYRALAFVISELI